MEKNVSIIIPAYNIAGYLERCLDSILAQSYQDYEVILVDDGSTDTTAAIADTYAAKDSRIQVIHKENEGVSIARNVGIGKAQGNFFLFFDGDDFVEPDCIFELITEMQDHKYDMIIYGYYRYFSKEKTEICLPRFQKQDYKKEQIIEQLLPAFIGLSYQNVTDWIAHREGALYVENPALWRTMISADLIRDNHLMFDKNLRVGEDTIFICQCLSYAESCHVLQKCYYYLVTRETSTIYQYEKNSLAKLEGKQKLLAARQNLTEDIRERCGVDIADTWQGTVLMSVMELAFLLSRKNENYKWEQRYELFLQYTKNPVALVAMEHFHISVTKGIFAVPFWMLRKKMYFPVFFAAACLQMLHYEFKRG